MKRAFAVPLLALSLVSGCASSKAAPRAAREEPKAGTGASIDDAVLILESNEDAGIRAERRWLSEHYPGYRKVQSALDFKGDRHFDVVTIRLSDGREETVFFDITSFYGFN
jgi:hypothetical protein